MKRILFILGILVLSLAGWGMYRAGPWGGGGLGWGKTLPGKPTPVRDFWSLTLNMNFDAATPIGRVESRWDDSYVAMALETIQFSRTRRIAEELVRVLEAKTGERYGFDINRWYDWLWRQDVRPHPDYATFKSVVYGAIDPRFRGYFDLKPPCIIRLDEIRWGGVRQDGIPPLRRPRMILAREADYLDKDHVVFGIEVNGDARAYPKRILAWHEVFVDEIGGEPVTGVYCTLCGTMIPYRSVFGGVRHDLGTSGFLYRSNKLMYDRATQSLWSTLEGRPVVGPLVGQGIALERLPVVTTTWGEWKRRHPDTTVLALETGHERDYSEGAAYRDYFATDKLMFNVPELDPRLRNKDEVLGLVFPDRTAEALALSETFLRDHPVYHDRVGPVAFVVLTDPSGANRTYADGGRRFIGWDTAGRLVDAKGRAWAVAEDAMTAPDGTCLDRLPAHRAFWFGWYAAYPHTRLRAN